jgi:hypothetical protein
MDYYLLYLLYLLLNALKASLRNEKQQYRNRHRHQKGPGWRLELLTLRAQKKRLLRAQPEQRRLRARFVGCDVLTVMPGVVYINV